MAKQPAAASASLVLRAVRAGAAGRFLQNGFAVLSCDLSQAVTLAGRGGTERHIQSEPTSEPAEEPLTTRHLDIP